MTRLLLAAIVAGTSLWLALRLAESRIPQHLPWTPLDLRAPVGMATGRKIGALADDGPLCRDLLRRTGTRFGAVAPRRDGPFCAMTDALVIERSRIAWSPTPVRVTCPLLAALVVWEAQVVQPAARVHLGEPVVRIEQLGTYSCRPIAGSSSWSEHATANAVDVAAFVTASGRRISLLEAWAGRSDARSFLRSVRDGSCDLFGTTLSPDYNAAHADHFHFDMKLRGYAGFCR